MDPCPSVNAASVSYFSLYELSMFVLMLQSVSSVVMFVCFMYCLIDHFFTFELFALMTAKLK